MKKRISESTLFLLVIFTNSFMAFSQSGNGFKIFSTQKAIEKNSTIRINNSSHNLEIKIWDQQTIKIEMSLPDSLSIAIEEKSWLENSGTRISKFMNRVDIVFRSLELVNTVREKGGDSKTAAMSDSGGSGITPGDVLTGKAVNDEIGLRFGVDDATIVSTIAPMTIYLPGNSIIELVNRNSTVRVNGNIENAFFNVENSIVDATNAARIRLFARYSKLRFEIIGSCEADISNSTFRAAAIDILDIESTGSTVEYEKGNKINVRSSLDKGYLIEEIEQAEGRLLFSKIRIDKLNKRLDLVGSDYDVKVRKINPDVELVKIDNSWGDLRMPIIGLVNYEIKFNGKNSAVFAPFELVPGAKEKPENNENASLNLVEDVLYLRNHQRPNAPPYFSTKSGSTTGKHTQFDIACSQCSVDFK